MSLRVLIADDEPLALTRLRHLLQSEPGVEIVGECTNGAEAVKLIQQKTPHLIFLDVEMPQLDGFGVLESLEMDYPPVVIFVTAHDGYAVRAFEASALDYLVKPFDRERFRKALRRALQKFETNQKLQTYEDTIRMLRQLKLP
jgi:two-component system, LytTR family, response regulator